MRSLLTAGMTAVFGAILLVTHVTNSYAGKSITFKNNLLSIEATNTLLPELLIKIGDLTGVDIFLSTAIQPDKVTLTTKNLPLEESFKRLLREYSYAAVFTGSEDKWHITAIKVFPKGEHSGRLIPLAMHQGESASSSEKTKTVYITEGHEMPFGSGLPKSGAVAPSAAMSSLPAGATVETAPWVVLQQQFVSEQIQAFQKQLLLKRKIAATTDPEKKEALASAYADEVAQYQTMREAQTNQLESIKRIYNAKAAAEALSTAAKGNN